MWDAISKVLTSPNAWTTLLFLIVLLFVIVVMIKNGKFSINTRAVKIGGNETERTIIRQQTEWAHIYISSIETKISSEPGKNNYFLKYILERVFDEVVTWITYNHITTTSAYVEIKQDKISALVYSMGVGKEFQTPEFKARMNKWTKEIIERLVQIREVYTK